MLVVANLSRFAQYVELDLSRFKGLVPVELFGQTRFPPIGELPYLLTLGPHAFYWLAIEGARDEPSEIVDLGTPVIEGSGSIDALVTGRARPEFERALARFLPGRRWFAGKARTIRNVAITDCVPLTGGRSSMGARVLIVKVEFSEGEAESYSVPLSLVEGERAENLLVDAAQERRHAHLPPRRQRRDRRGPDRSRGLPGVPRGDARPADAQGLLGRAPRGPADPGPARLAQRPGAARARDLPGRAEQHLGDLRAEPDPEVLPQGRGGREPRPRARPLPRRALALRQHPRGGGVARLHRRRRPPGDARHRPRVRAQRGRRVAVHPGRPGPLLRAGAHRGRPAGRRAARRPAGRPDRRGARPDPRGRRRAGRLLHPVGPAPRHPGGRAARRPRHRHDGRRLHPRALHAPLPALGLSVDAQPHGAGDADAARRSAVARRSRPRRRRGAPRGREGPARALRPASRPDRSTPSASAATATCTSARCSSPAATS